MKKIIFTFFVFFLLTNCTYVSQGVVVDSDRYAAITKQDVFGDTADQVVYLDQNWDRYDSLWFYFTKNEKIFCLLSLQTILAKIWSNLIISFVSSKTLVLNFGIQSLNFSYSFVPF